MTFNSLKQWAALHPGKRKALTAAIWHLVCARLIFSVTPASAIIRRLKNGGGDLAGENEALSDDAELIAWAIYAAARRLPWRTDCLIQATAARRWLDQRHIHSTFHIAAQGQTGGNLTGSGRLSAHVWLEVGGKTVTGGDLSPELIRFAEV